jgi:predicted PurR-regulated permease PerM
MSVTGGLLWLFVNEFGSILKDWPGYQTNITRKVQAIRGAPGEGIQNIERTFTQLKQDFAGNASPTQAGPSDKPVPVQVVSGSTLLSSLGFAGATLAELLAQVFAICVLTLFVLLNREQLRNRVLRLLGTGMLVIATTTIDEAASRVSRYLLSQFAVNGCFGVVLAVGLALIGVPYAALWGVLVLTLRFVPYIGTLIAAACPFVMSLAAFDGWHKPLEVFALYAAIELIISTIIEPWLYANQTGISSVAYLVSAAFWTLIWGPIGLVLSTPLTVCLVVMGRHLPPLEFLRVLLGDEPALAEDVHFYQRLLADDEDETAGLLDTALKTEPLPRVFDGLVIPALSIAEQDRHEGRLSGQQATVMYDMTREIVEIAAERHPCAATDQVEQPAVVCIPARDEADEVVAGMLVLLLRQCGGAAVVRHEVEQGDESVVVSALPPFAVIHARSVCKRIRADHPNTRIVLGVWGSKTPAEVIQERLGTNSVDAVVTSLEQALQLLTAAAAPELVVQPTAAD